MLPTGSRVGEYEIEAELGEGGMARVYRARHVLLDTVHAIKVLDPELRANPQVRQRFLDEARIQAKHLDHPGIVKVTNIVATAEHAALVMELASGGSLEAQVHALTDRPDEIRRIMLAVLDAVGHAHAANIIHRDLKPANVLLARKGDQVVPKVTDFGIAKLGADVGGTKKATLATARMGTLSYMSPEQIRRASDVTARSDIFSLGAVLYELATGALPFDGVDDFEVMEKIVHGRYVAPAVKRPGVDPVLAEVIEKALAVEPADRYASCEEMAVALRRRPPGPPKPEPPKPGLPKPGPSAAVGPRPRARPPSALGSLAQIALVLGGLGAVVGVVAGGVYLAHHAGRATPEAVRAPVAADVARYRKALGLTGPLRATIATSQGTLTCDLFDDRAPIAVANFVGLATGLKPWRDGLTGPVKRGVPFYDDRTFYRVVPGLVIQGGRPPAQVASADPGYRFATETAPAAQYPRGALVTVGDETGNGAEFKILDSDIPALAGKDTVFGQCSPLDVISNIARVPRDDDDRPREPMKITMVAIGAVSGG